MEDVLNVLARPYDIREPVVTLDERPVVLRGASRPGRIMAPGQIAREDYEYVRKGTANVYCIVEPKAGRHLTHATHHRKGPRFVDALQRIARRYRNATTIHLLMDNLNLHGPSPLIGALGAEQGAALWARFTPHYTPKHGSWLNPAEIEASLWSRECHGRDRVDTLRPSVIARAPGPHAQTAVGGPSSGDLLPPRHGESSATNGEALCRGRGTSFGVTSVATLGRPSL
jgi:hypothetical protein